MNAMPGPQFGQEMGEKSWFRNNAQKIVLSLIVVLLAIGGFYFYKNYQERKALLKPALEEMQSLNATPSPQESPIASAANEQPQSSVLGVQQSKMAAPETRKENSNIIARAAKGNGATHLARQSLKEYLKDKSDLAGQLKAEQKIYIEDYLQKHVPRSKTLKVGDEITFSDSLIQDAISQAQKLTDKQINNLHKYVLLAPSLN